MNRMIEEGEMIEYKNGSFGDIFEGEALIKKLFDMKKKELSLINKIHFGTVEELEEIKKSEVINERKQGSF